MKNLTSKIAYGIVALALILTAGQVAYAKIYNPPAGGSSGVTSVGLSDSASTLTIGSTPVTTTGTITATLNLGHTNTWTVLQNFNYSSSTVYSSFQTSSTTNAFIGTFDLGTTTAGVLNVSASGRVYAGSASAGNLTGVITSTGLATVLGANGSVNSSQMQNWNSDETGTGAAVYASGPFITSPIIVTDARIPIINGGAAAGSTLDLRSTSAVGTTDALRFFTGSQVEAGRINTSGLWLFGTTTSPLMSKVVIASTTAPQLTLSAGSGVSQWAFRAESDGGIDIATTTVAGSATSSVVALGVTSGGVLKLGNYANCNTTNALQISSGQVVCGSTVSDSRLKKDINPLTNGLDMIMALKPVTFFFNDLTNHNTTDPREQMGFIAQDVEPLIPSAVGLSDDGYKTLDKTKIIPYLVDAIKTQQKEINELKAQIKTLKK